MGREVKTPEGATIRSLGVFVQCNPLAPESTSVTHTHTHTHTTLFMYYSIVYHYCCVSVCMYVTFRSWHVWAKATISLVNHVYPSKSFARGM